MLRRASRALYRYKDDLNDRYSERFETAEKGRLQTQAEKEAARDKELARTA